MSEQAGWRTRQHATVQNCGKLTDVMLWKSTDSDAFHIRCKVKEMGQQGHVTFESILPFMEALEVYTTMTTEAVVEVVAPTNPGRQIISIEDEDG